MGRGMIKPSFCNCIPDVAEFAKNSDSPTSDGVLVGRFCIFRYTTKFLCLLFRTFSVFRG